MSTNRMARRASRKGKKEEEKANLEQTFSLGSHVESYPRLRAPNRPILTIIVRETAPNRASIFRNLVKSLPHERHFRLLRGMQKGYFVKVMAKLLINRLERIIRGRQHLHPFPVSVKYFHNNQFCWNLKTVDR